MRIHIIHHPDEETAERLCRIEEMLGIIMEKLEFVMPAIDDLKTAIAALITEATSDIAALVAKINAQSNQDPAIVALTTQVTDASAAMHRAFNATTGTPANAGIAGAGDAPVADPAAPAA